MGVRRAKSTGSNEFSVLKSSSLVVVEFFKIAEKLIERAHNTRLKIPRKCLYESRYPFII